MASLALAPSVAAPSQEIVSSGRMNKVQSRQGRLSQQQVIPRKNGRSGGRRVGRTERRRDGEQTNGARHALDKAFALPLTPIVLERSPKVVPSTILSPRARDLEMKQAKSARKAPVNGWNNTVEMDLGKAAQLSHSSDLEKNVKLARSVSLLNKNLAKTSSAMAFGGELCNMISAVAPDPHISGLGSAFTVAAFVIHSLSHAVQLGAAYETYRTRV